MEIKNFTSTMYLYETNQPHIDKQFSCVNPVRGMKTGVNV